ncbi:hypothetical protein EZV62_024564 [Acer yangbiense]|uniref:Disease resistance protein Roq1-like winged-helix domain-containing protein n=1 Tax=Acer yangbiense TaxID=1000413 RepID=A0A5C7GVY6_9ROSI|nr:hypothetical protein EZV62_024564 [Acer yangbiense]
MRVWWLVELLDGAFKVPSIKEMENDTVEWDRYMKRYSNGYYRRSCIGTWDGTQREKNGIFNEFFEPYEPLDYDGLKEAANISGFDSRVHKPESVLIEAIVQDVLERMNGLSSSDTSHLVGIDSKIVENESMLNIGTNDVRRQDNSYQFENACGFYTYAGIDILINKSMIAISSNMITMYDLIQVMAMKIVRQECPEDPNNST